MVSRRMQHAQVRAVLGWLPVAALAACVLAACEDSSSGGSKPDAGQSTAQQQPKAAGDATEKLNKRCEQLGQACGQKEKHKEQITKECKEAAWQQVDKGCADQAVAAVSSVEGAR